jgi:hypothetical protein
MLRFVPRIAAVLLLVVAGTVSPAAGGEQPFHASGEGYVVYNTLYGGGEATHLGRSSLYLTGTDFLQYGFFFPSGAQIRSASGDRLCFDFDANTYSFDPATELRGVSATVTFIGGTGRFQDAIGSADVVFVFDSLTQQFLFLIDGSIDY